MRQKNESVTFQKLLFGLFEVNKNQNMFIPNKNKTYLRTNLKTQVYG